MKLTRKLVFSIISFLITTTLLSQSFTDQEIGFDGGEIPSEIGHLVNLISLDLGSYQQNRNSLTGDIPVEIGELKKLISLNFNNNQFTGTIPNSIGQLINLESLNSVSNNLTGSIPSEIGQLTKLKRLNLRLNYLTGEIPSQIGNLLNLNYLGLDINQLSGSIPEELGELTKLIFLQLESNKLGGNVPGFANLSQLLNYHIFYNNFRFIDLIDQFTFNKIKLGNGFQYLFQSKTDDIKTVNVSIGASTTLTMYEDGRFTPDDTFQWYKNNTLIPGATSRELTITDLKSTDSGSYYCISSHLNNPDMSPLVLEREPITLNIVHCEAIQGTIKSDSEKNYTNSESNFSFETIETELTYKWTITTTDGQVVDTKESGKTDSYSYNFSNYGDYTLTAIVTDINGCENIFEKSIKVLNRYCAKEPINFAFETTSTNLNYIWTSTNASGAIVDTKTNTTGLYSFTAELSGEYEIKLTVDGLENCETLFSKKITIEDCLPFVSCTQTNIHTPEIHRLFISLINKLASTPNGTDANSYANKEIAALSPYTIDSKARIYNFSNTDSAISFSFSETSARSDVQLPRSPSGSITSIDLSKYRDAIEKNTVTINYSDGTNNPEGYIRNVNFCVDELSCVSHVALVIDESGSISSTEANKIKKQLKAFILQQALTNDAIGSNIYVSLTGMSDSDQNTRTDFVLPTKLTNTPASLNSFNTWIDNFGKRNGQRGVSASSDYWRSGLEGALNYSMKPKMVIMITDGCQTADVAALKETMKKFNNAPESNPNSPHLYVVGIENGFYVDESFYTNKFSSPAADPNNIQNNLVNTVTQHLGKSLQYLFEFPPTEFPKSDINQFDVGTYFGHADFNLLASDETYFSDKLADSKIVCGTAAIKDFCDDCLSFKPEPGKEYLLSAWVKEELLTQVKTYENSIIKIVFYNNKEALDIPGQRIDSLSVKASGNIIDGWQRVVKKFKIPENTITIGIELENNSPSIPVYFDDIRIHPLQGSVKSFVYDPETFKLMSELDQNNYSTFYEYDNEGGLVRVKKETEKGIKTIQETRSGSTINTNH